MSFEESLQKIASGCDASAAALMGTDGIAIAQVDGPGGGEDAGEQIAMVGAEFGRIVEEVRKASDSLEGGAVEELCIRMSGVQILLRVVDADTMLVVTLPAAGNTGKARFQMRRHLLALRDEL